MRLRLRVGLGGVAVEEQEGERDVLREGVALKVGVRVMTVVWDSDSVGVKVRLKLEVALGWEGLLVGVSLVDTEKERVAVGLAVGVGGLGLKVRVLDGMGVGEWVRVTVEGVRDGGETGRVSEGVSVGDGDLEKVAEREKDGEPLGVEEAVAEEQVRLGDPREAVGDKVDVGDAVEREEEGVSVQVEVGETVNLAVAELEKVADV